LSDHVGRRPVLIAATVAQAATMWLFATADGVSELIIARVLQGLSTGAAVAAVGAGLLDLDKTRGTVANAIAPLLGTASGGIAAGLMVQYLPAPTHLIYLVLGIIFILQGIGVVLMPESSTPRVGALASLKPQFKLPATVREPLFLAVPALVATWALAGFYGSLGPTLVRSMSGLSSSLLGGLALFILAGSGGVSVLLLRRHEPRTMMSFGASVLFAGVAATLAGLSYHSPTAFFLGTALAGMGFGAGFQGAVRTVMPFAAPQERAGVLSLIFVVSYLAMGVPAVIAGYLVSQQGSIFTTAREFGAVVMLLAALSLLGTVKKRSK
jgi:MFS family permease